MTGGRDNLGFKNDDESQHIFWRIFMHAMPEGLNGIKLDLNKFDDKI